MADILVVVAIGVGSFVATFVAIRQVSALIAAGRTRETKTTNKTEHMRIIREAERRLEEEAWNESHSGGTDTQE